MGLIGLVDVDAQRQSWVSNSFPDPDDPYDSVWHNKLAFQQVVNGDFLALDLAPSAKGAVVYLSHDDDPLHGYRLGDTFAQFVDAWTALGCPGPEGWQLRLFLSSTGQGIDPHGENAERWRRWFGLKDPGQTLVND